MTTAVAAVEPWGAYAAGSRIAHFEWWCREHCRHIAGPFAGKPLDLEPWQREFFAEGMAVDEDDLPYWSTVVEIVPRKNGKTTAVGAIGGYGAAEEDDLPNVGLAATSDDQASELFDAIAGFIHGSPYLDQLFHVRDYDGEIARVDAGAYIRRMRMDWRRLHGKNLSTLIADEIHAWTTPNLHRCWEALTTGDGARPSFQAWCITTEGELDDGGNSILDALVTDNESYGDVERRPGLTISRNHEARVLIYRFHAEMPAADPQPVRDAYRAWKEAAAAGDPAADELEAEFERAADVCVDAVKRANPASWVRRSYLRRKAIDPKISRSSFLRYHACVKAASDDAWLTEGQWDDLAVTVPDGGAFIADGTQVDLGADGSRVHDTTVVAWACRMPSGKIRVDCRIFAAAKDAVHHELAVGAHGQIDYTRIEDFIVEQCERFVVKEAAFDPTYLDRSADHLVDELPDTAVFPVQPGSAHYREALTVLDRLILEGKLEHPGDPFMRAHVMATKAQRDPESQVLKNLRKRHQERRIDAVIAIALAVWRASRRPVKRSWRPA